MMGSYNAEAAGPIGEIAQGAGGWHAPAAHSIFAASRDCVCAAALMGWIEPVRFVWSTRQNGFRPLKQIGRAHV